MTSPSLPELPPLAALAALPRCPSRSLLVSPQQLRQQQQQQPLPPGALPRHVSPPHAGEATPGALPARFLHQHPIDGAGRIESTQLQRSASCSSSHLVFVPHHELPPLAARASSLLPSRGSSRLHSSSLSRRADLDLFYDTHLSNESKPSAPLGSRAPARPASLASRSALGSLDVAWHEGQDDARAITLEIESLKRQVSRLTQLRRDRDGHIQDLLTDAEGASQRPEGHTGRGDADAGEGVAETQREQEAVVGKRARSAYEAAFAQQAQQYEAELAVLRKALCAEASLRLSERGSLKALARKQAETAMEQERRRWCSAVLADWREVARRGAATKCAAEPGSPAEGEQPLQAIQADCEDAPDAQIEARVQKVTGGVDGAHTRRQRLVLTAWAADASHKLHVITRAWAEVTITAQRDQAEAAQAVILRRKVRAQSFLTVQASLLHAKHAVLSAWAAVVVEAGCERRLVEQVALREGDRSALKDCEDALCSALRDRALYVAQAQADRTMAATLLLWSAAARHAQRESAQRLRLLTATADSSSELYRLRSEAVKTAVELRRQRRAHGVAAIHASLDRRLQAVVHAWSTVAKDAQRESMYQRQLDIAAAESAAGCAVLRMEGRRAALELRHQRRMQALRSVQLGVHHWRHMVLYAWSVVVADGRCEALLVQELGLAAAQVEACQLEAKRRAEAHAAQRSAQADSLYRLHEAHDLGALLALWAAAARQRRALRTRALRWSALAAEARDVRNALVLVAFRAWSTSRTSDAGSSA